MVINGDAAQVATAYVKARSEMDTLLAKEGKGVYGKYMELTTILEMVMPILTSNGLVVTQEPTSNEFGVAVATSIIHCSGATIEFAALTIPITERKPHAAGSALSYAKRYALAAVFGLAGDDDDGQAAQDSYKAKAAKPVAQVDDALWETPAAHAKKPDTLSPAQLSRIHILGKEIYSEAWSVEGPKMVREISNGKTSTKDLTPKEAAALISDLEAKRKPVNGNGHKVAA